MKNRLVWYVDTLNEPKGRQSTHVATVVILIEKMATDAKRYRVGVTVKHPKDKLPFIKKEGRRLATERAQNAIPVFSIGDATIEAWNGVQGMLVNGERIDTNRLLANIQHVLNKM